MTEGFSHFAFYILHSTFCIHIPPPTTTKPTECSVGFFSRRGHYGFQLPMRGVPRGELAGRVLTGVAYTNYIHKTNKINSLNLYGKGRNIK